MSEDDGSTDEPSAAIDLSRRKDLNLSSGRRRPRSGGPPPHANATSLRTDVLRHPMVGAGQVAAPYITMARIALAQLGRDRLARGGALVLALFVLVGVFADVLANDLPLACRWRGAVYLMPNVTHPKGLAGMDFARMDRERRPDDWMIPALVRHGPTEPGEPSDVLVSPFEHGHPMGTDPLARDVFARVVYGARTALGIGLAASVVLVAIGVALGAVAGFAGGMADALVARAVEALSAVPTLVLVLVIGALVTHPTTTTLICTIALTRWTELARLVRGEVLLALGADYVTAARALGASPPRVLWRHVLPNAIGPAVVGATFAMAWVVLIEATIDFMGVGSWATTASWGEVMGEARSHPNAWWLVAFPGGALLATLVALNLVGEAARNALDPRLRGDELMKTLKTPGKNI